MRVGYRPVLDMILGDSPLASLLTVAFLTRPSLACLNLCFGHLDFSRTPDTPLFVIPLARVPSRKVDNHIAGMVRTDRVSSNAVE